MQQLLDHDNLYGVLDVHPTASAHEIQVAYRKRVMLWHPDRNDRPEAEERFKLIRSAYETLRDPHRRAEYDRRAAARAKRPHSHPDRSAHAAGREPCAPGASDVRRRVQITLDQQLHGGRIELQLTRTEYCSVCKGCGAHGKPVPCDTCSGSGQVRPSLALFPFFLGAPTPCGDCAGEGTAPAQCAACSGNGTIAPKRGRLRFEVAAGMQPGTTLRIRGHGRRSRSGKASGDLLVQIGIAAHPLFEPDFPHLRCEMPVSVFRALAGGMIEVPTLERPVSIPLPANVVDGTEIHIAGHGMLKDAGGKRGDLLVKLRLIRPRKLSASQRGLLAKLDELAGADPAHVEWVRRCRDAERMKRPTDRQSA
jgi:molecular chaperone DnaJ